ncbi:hypothetical protein AURDEDRAFT_121968 [Auricularia subglabra TFB-10046 SS5]|nr:hypothetical protein AURDEDRAFT_121968 [Auricularia subglabra TFB-10046 SS5]
MDARSPPESALADRAEAEHGAAGAGSGSGAAPPVSAAAPPHALLHTQTQHQTQMEDPLAFTIPPFLWQGVGNQFTQDPLAYGGGGYNPYYSADAYGGVGGDAGGSGGGSGGGGGGYDAYKAPVQPPHQQKKQQPVPAHVHGASSGSHTS